MKKYIGIVVLRSFNEAPDERAERLQEEAERMGVLVKMFDHGKFAVVFGPAGTRIYYDGKAVNIAQFRAIIPIAHFTENIVESLFCIRAFEDAGVPSFNPSDGVMLAKDKIRSTYSLSLKGLCIIPSAVNFSPYGLRPIWRMAGGDHVVCKLGKGSLGKGVALFPNKISLVSTVELLASKGVKASSLLFQKFVKEARGSDCRYIVVGKRVVAAMRRRSTGIDFRSNLSGVGTGEAIAKVPVADRRVAVASIAALGLHYGGVDIMHSKGRPMVVEVNSNPGLLIEKVTGINVTKKILEHVQRHS